MTASYRQLMYDLVSAMTPYDALEQEHCARTLNWIASGAPLCRIEKPAIPAQHLVSYIVLFDPQTQQILLVDHRLSGLWLPSGGHVEPGEDPVATALRELQEELHINGHLLFPGPIFLTVTETVGHIARHTDVSLWFVSKGDSRQMLAFDKGEFQGIAWFALDQLPLARTDPHMLRFVNKLQQKMSERRSAETQERTTQSA